MAVGDIHEKYVPDEKTEDFLRLINRALDELKPDLAVLMGDIVSVHFKNEQGEYQDLSIEQRREEVQRVVEPFAKRNVPLALVFGNHDGEGGRPKEPLLSLFQEYANFRNIDTPGITGTGNCNLLIKNNAGDKDVFNIWLIDSGDRAPAGRGKYAYVETDQIEWYEQTSNMLQAKNNGEPLPSVLFQHIPVMEEYKLLKKTNRYNPCAVKGNSSHDKDYYVLNKKAASGYLGEGPCTPDYNKGQFESWKKQGDIVAAFFGHDHMNDFVGKVDGILLGQCKCSGFHIYGDGLRQGVRIITLNEKEPRKIETKMHRYRDYFGNKANSIKGYMLLSDRFHIIFERALKIVIPAAVIATVGILIFHWFK
ncbi:MAG TPA: metallophosphoesterase [Clostridia bacterium]|nr:metallophosphoesterase [Clostridia bacterium]